MNLQRILASAGAIVVGVLLAVVVVGNGSSDPTPRQIDVAPRAALVEEPSTTIPAPAADITTSTVAPNVSAPAGPGPIAATPKPTETTIAPAPAPAPQPTSTTTCRLSSIPTLPNGQPAGPPTMICG